MPPSPPQAAFPFPLASLPWLPLALYTANFLWFSAAFIKFTFRPRDAFLAGTRDAYIHEGRIVNSPLDKANPPASCHKVRGDAYHYDLLVYLGGMNGAMAVFVFTRMVGLPSAGGIWHWQWRHDDDEGMVGAEVQRLCVAVWGVAHMSQSCVGWVRIMRSGRWRWGGLWGLRTITLVDTLLWVGDWTVAWYG